MPESSSSVSSSSSKSSSKESESESLLLWMSDSLPLTKSTGEHAALVLGALFPACRGLGVLVFFVP